MGSSVRLTGLLRGLLGNWIVGQRQFQPKSQVLLGLKPFKTYENKPAHRSSGEIHRTAALAGQRIIVSIRSNARHKPVLLHAYAHLSVHHEAQPTHHSLRFGFDTLP